MPLNRDFTGSSTASVSGELGKIGITGIHGLIGWHTRCFLKAHFQHLALAADRAVFQSQSELEAFARSADVIIHLAGMNRGDAREVAETNVALTDRLIQALDAVGSRAHVIFASSTHTERGTSYGQSKLRCSELLDAWATRSGGKHFSILLPHVFGEGGRPFYNSAISTFCHQIAQGEAPQILQDSELELIHVSDVSAEFVSAIRNRKQGLSRVQGRRMMVSEALRRITEIASSYRNSIIPDLSDRINLQLFNTYRSYLYPKHYPVTPTLRTDARGSLFETVKSLHGGQCFVSTTHPGIVRGNHYHIEKFERFCVIQGEASIRIRKLFSDEIREFRVSGSQPQFIDIPTLHTHDIINTGNTELMTLFWAHELYDPEHPDTFGELVILNSRPAKAKA